MPEINGVLYLMTEETCMDKLAEVSDFVRSACLSSVVQVTITKENDVCFITVKSAKSHSRSLIDIDKLHQKYSQYKDVIVKSANDDDYYYGLVFK